MPAVPTSPRSWKRSAPRLGPRDEIVSVRTVASCASCELLSREKRILMAKNERLLEALRRIDDYLDPDHGAVMAANARALARRAANSQGGEA